MTKIKKQEQTVLPLYTLILTVVLAGVCAVLISGQTTLPQSLATIIPDPTPTSASHTSQSNAEAKESSPRTSTTASSSSTSSDLRTTFSTIMTTDSSGVHATEVAIVTGVAATDSGGSGGGSNGALIGGKSSLVVREF
jgi:hypothetical protein